jgi:hypothetical protein
MESLGQSREPGTNPAWFWVILGQSFPRLCNLGCATLTWETVLFTVLLVCLIFILPFFKNFFLPFILHVYEFTCEVFHKSEFLMFNLEFLFEKYFKTKIQA